MKKPRNLSLYTGGGGGTEKKVRKTFTSQKELDDANTLAKRMAIDRGLVSGESTYVAKKIGDLVPEFNYMDLGTGKSFDPATAVKPLARKLPSGVTVNDIKSSEGLFWYEDPITGSVVDVDPNIVLNSKKKTFAGGGVVTPGLSAGLQIAGQVPTILNGLISLLEGGPNAQTKEPLFDTTTMRTMVNPYKNFAFGGTIEDLTEDELTQLQQMADEQGISIEELFTILQSQQSSDEEEQAVMEEQSMMDMESEDVEEFAYGGRAKRKIEVEGGEVIQTPSGDIAKVKGPKHEKGGVDIAVPGGTKIYSDRVKIDGKTMQERKLSRERTMKRIEKMLAKNPTDTLLKASFERTSEVNSMEEQEDMIVQETLNTAANQFGFGGRVKKRKMDYAYGGEEPFFSKTGWVFPDLLKSLLTVGNLPLDPTVNAETVAEINRQDPVLPPMGTVLKGKIAPYIQRNQIASKDNNPLTETFQTINRDDFSEGTEEAQTDAEGNPIIEGMGTLGVGDIVDMAGNAFNAIAPIINTNQNRKANRPNINRYLGFGQDALDTNQDAQDYVAGVKTNAKTDVATSSNSAYLRNRNSAQGVNTVRALDIATNMGTNKALNDIDDSFSKQMMALLDRRSELENMQDRMEMQGEERRDIEDKADQDNYYSNMAQNLVNLGTNVQGIGGAINTAKGNRIDAELLSQLSKYGLTFDKNGRLVSKK